MHHLKKIPASSVITPAGRIHLGSGVSCSLAGEIAFAHCFAGEIFEANYQKTQNAESALGGVVQGAFTVPLYEVAAAYDRTRPRVLVVVRELIK